MEPSKSSTKNKAMVNERLVEYKLVQALLKTAKGENLLSSYEYSRVLKKMNIKYKDVRE